MAERIDGKAYASRVRETIAGEVRRLQSGHGFTPGLAVVLVGEDPASEVYVRNKNRQTLEVGMRSLKHTLSVETTQEELLALVRRLNGDASVNGILVQLPLPKQIDADAVINAIDPAKDVDGFHINSVGSLWVGAWALVPCTPTGCMMLLRDRLGDLTGKRALVLGRSNIVGKPMAALLLASLPLAADAWRIYTQASRSNIGQ